jgi:hypothetical protein
VTYFVDLLLKAGILGDHGQRFLIELILSHVINIDQLLYNYIQFNSSCINYNRLHQILERHGESMVQFTLRIRL